MLYRLAYVCAYLLGKLVFRLRVIGAGHVPDQGGVILAANHVSYLDIPLLAVSLRRRVDFMGKAELFRTAVGRFLFRRLGAFPVRRGEGDRQAMGEAVRRIREGRVVAIFPEGTRSRDGTLRRGKGGVGALAVQSGARVIPVFIRGTFEWRRLRPVTVIFGSPIDCGALLREAEGEKSRESYAAVSQRIMEEIARLSGETKGL